MKLEHILSVQNFCGEIPYWVPDNNSVYWVDMDKKIYYSYNLKTEHYKSHNLQYTISGWGRREKRGWITATEKGIAFWDEESLDFDFLVDPEKDNTSITYADAAVDRDGRFLIGTRNHIKRDDPSGSLYSFHHDGSWEKLDSGFALSNGLGFSPDGKILYFTDMFHRRILSYDYNKKTGKVYGKKTFAIVPENKGYPDGLIVDSEGYVWSCHWGGYCITRYTPEGQIDCRIELPVPNVTCCAFCGKNLNDLYITTAYKGLSKQERKKYPLSGDIFRLKTDIQGLIEAKFKG
jgi:L-arabinonolactonase